MKNMWFVLSKRNNRTLWRLCQFLLGITDCLYSLAGLWLQILQNNLNTFLIPTQTWTLRFSKHCCLGNLPDPFWAFKIWLKLVEQKHVSSVFPGLQHNTWLQPCFLPDTWLLQLSLLLFLTTMAPLWYLPASFLFKRKPHICPAFEPGAPKRFCSVVIHNWELQTVRIEMLHGLSGELSQHFQLPEWYRLKRAWSRAAALEMAPKPYKCRKLLKEM